MVRRRAGAADSADVGWLIACETLPRTAISRPNRRDARTTGNAANATSAEVGRWQARPLARAFQLSFPDKQFTLVSHPSTMQFLERGRRVQIYISGGEVDTDYGGAFK